jgi:hypothetical protein
MQWLEVVSIDYKRIMKKLYRENVPGVSLFSGLEVSHENSQNIILK